MEAWERVTQTHYDKLKQLLDDTYPQGNITRVDTIYFPDELKYALNKVQRAVDDLQELVRSAEDALEQAKPRQEGEQS